MENVFLTSLTTPEVRQMFREELINFFPEATKSPNQNYNPEIITGEDLSKKLGVTIQTLIRWRQKGKIPFLQIGNSIRYDFNKVIEALEVNKKKGASK
jgi:hypothetical protein